MLRHALIAMAVLLSFGVFAGAAQAKKQAKPVSVFPAPNSNYASDDTTFSFRGLKPKQLGPVRVVGSRTGVKRTTRLRHSDGRGVSVIPKGLFKRGETVRVFTRRKIKLTRNGDFVVRIGNFYGSDDKNALPPGGSSPNPALKSRPDLKPPQLNVLTPGANALPGKILYAPAQFGMAIADNWGRMSWFRPVSFGGKGDRVANFQKQKYKGKPVLTYWKGANTTQSFTQVGAYDILNSSYKKIASVSPGNGYKPDVHEFQITPRNTALVLAYRGVKADLSKWGGRKNDRVLDNIVQEVDIKTGAVLFEWHALDAIGLGASQQTIVKPTADVPFPTWDYAHVNAVHWDGKSVLVSARATNSVYRINRADARVQWRLRGDRLKATTSNFKVAPDATFGYQHDVRRTKDGDISLFDNGFQPGLPVVNATSSAVILKLSGKGKNRKASLVERFSYPGDGLAAFATGGAQPLSNEGMFVSWGTVPQITEYNAAGDIVFDATLPPGGFFNYRSSKTPWAGKPTDRPAIASEADGPGAKVYASWNGATDIRTWKVFTGTGENDLVEAGESSWTGLETAITIAAADAKVKVVAYDAGGNELGESGLVAIGEQSR